MMESFAALMLLGVRVREIHGLEEQTLWLPDRLLLLVDQALSQRRRQAVADRLMADAAAWGATTA